MGVSERVIRHWKQHPIWEQERQKLINERAEAMGITDEKRREEYKEKLQKQQQDLEKLRDAIKVIAARLFKITNAALAELCEHPDSVKACSILTKSGVHIQSKVAIDAVLAIVALNREILQFYVVLDYLQNLNDDEDVSN